MCGRFTQYRTWSEIHALYRLTLDVDRGRNVPARYNIAPTQDVLFVADIDGERRLLEGRWWLVPHWAKELQSKYPMFNARSEDAHAKPAFRDAYKGRRCLIPADGYYEWTKSAVDGQKDPHLIHLPGHEHFAFAGLWATNDHVGVTSCTILTAAAADSIRHLHSRMPIALDPAVFDAWTNPGTSVDEARNLLSQNRGSDLVSYRVGREVNSSRQEGEHLIRPVESV